jgi:hypothetical protein
VREGPDSDSERESSETEEDERREARDQEEEKTNTKDYARDFSDISEAELEQGMVSKTWYINFCTLFYTLQDAALHEIGDVAGELTLASGEIFPATPRGATEFVSM